MTVSTIHVEDFSEKSGINRNGKPFTRFAVKDTTGDWYSTFTKGIIDESMKGQKVEIEWEQEGDFKNLLRATPTDNPDVEPRPEPGTGNYIKGKEAPETQRNIRASVALENAVAWCAASDDARAALSEHGVVKVARVFYDALTELAEGKDPAGPTTSPSSEVPL